MTRYRIDSDSLYTINFIDKETAHFWHEWKDPGYGFGYYSRAKKRYTDLVFDSFDEAKAEMVRRLAYRLARAKDMTGRNGSTRRGEEVQSMTDHDLREEQVRANRPPHSPTCQAAATRAFLSGTEEGAE